MGTQLPAPCRNGADAFRSFVGIALVCASVLVASRVNAVEGPSGVSPPTAASGSLPAPAASTSAAPSLPSAAAPLPGMPLSPAKPKPPAGELSLSASLAGGASSWRGDGLGYGGLSVGLRLFGIATIFAEGRLGYGRVDQRLLTRLSIGVTAGYATSAHTYPWVSVAFAHQHEESMASVAMQPGGAVLGIGSGIRHRAGVETGLGCDFLLDRGRSSTITLGPDLSFAYLTYSSGPPLYFTVGARLRLMIPLF